MSFQVSPGVEVKEIDLTNVIPAVSTSIGGFAGYFKWGPVNQVTLLSSENELARQFGKPDISDHYAVPFLQAASFLQYGSALKVVRAESSDNAANAASSTTALTGQVIDFDVSYNSDTGDFVITRDGRSVSEIEMTADNTYIFRQEDSSNVNHRFELSSNDDVDSPFSITEDGFTQTTAGTAGSIGAYTQIAIDSDPASGDLYIVDSDVEAFVNVTFKISIIDAQDSIFIGNNTDFEDGNFTNDTDSLFAARYPGEYGNSLNVHVLTNKNFSSCPARTLFDSAPTGNEVHIAVQDMDGKWGEAKSYLETFPFVSLSPTAKKETGSTNYIKEIINTSSQYIYVVGDNNVIDDISNTYASPVSPDSPDSSYGAPADSPSTIYKHAVRLSGGQESSSLTQGDIEDALDYLSDSETEDVNLLFSQIAATGAALQNKVHTIAFDRKDCVAFLSPPISATKGKSGSDAKTAIEEFANDPTILRGTEGSYGVIDSGAVYVYDRYNDIYRFIPANGHVAGLCAKTDDVAEPWFSPAGFNRGGLRGIVKLAFNPNKAQRDELYKAGVNPIATFPGQGTVLFGDKTAQAKPSAFDRINVRRLFIVLEKAIATAAKFQLFELNDEFTRATFRNAVEPFLRDVQGRRGITDFAVICDETNNTGEVIDTNRFVADIYIKPARSINFITLNFIATRTGVDFAEVAGLSNS